MAEKDQPEAAERRVDQTSSPRLCGFRSGRDSTSLGVIAEGYIRTRAIKQKKVSLRQAENVNTGSVEARQLSVGAIQRSDSRYHQNQVASSPRLSRHCVISRLTGMCLIYPGHQFFLFLFLPSIRYV
jgi:hypothetical protein